MPQRDPYRNCITAAAFDSQLKWLARRGYRSMPLGVLHSLLEGESKEVPRRPVVITFDDGYEDNYSHAWPVLQRYGFTATIFLISGAIGGENSFDREYEPTAMLSVRQIHEMYRQGIDFGSHTHSHPASLTALSDQNLASELGASRRTIENLLDAPVPHFAYPHSQFDDRVEAAVEKAGYHLACAGVGTQFRRFALQRVEPPSKGGPRIEGQTKWRQLKWLVRNIQSARREDIPLSQSN